MINIMESIIQQCKDKYFELAPSKIHGVGLIAIRSIPKDTFLFEDPIKAEFIPYETLYNNGVQKGVIKSLNKNFAHDKKGIWLPNNTNYIQYVNFINHSKQHNTRCISDSYSNKYYTNRRIRNGEELCINYFEDDYCPSCVDFKDKT